MSFRKRSIPKVIVKCFWCDQEIRLPAFREGKVICPMCKKSFFCSTKQKNPIVKKSSQTIIDRMEPVLTNGWISAVFLGSIFLYPAFTAPDLERIDWQILSILFILYFAYFIFIDTIYLYGEKGIWNKLKYIFAVCVLFTLLGGGPVALFRFTEKAFFE